MAIGAGQTRNTSERSEAKPNAGVKVVPFVTIPKGDYKFLTKTSENFDAWDGAIGVEVAFFTETNQFMITTEDLAILNVGYEINDVTKDVDLVKIAVNADLQERVKYLHRLMDDFGFRIYALFLLGIVTSKGFQAFDIYAGVAGQGTFLPLEQVKMFLEQVNIPEVERS